MTKETHLIYRETPSGPPLPADSPESQAPEGVASEKPDAPQEHVDFMLTGSKKLTHAMREFGKKHRLKKVRITGPLYYLIKEDPKGPKADKAIKALEAFDAILSKLDPSSKAALLAPNLVISTMVSTLQTTYESDGTISTTSIGLDMDKKDKVSSISGDIYLAEQRFWAHDTAKTLGTKLGTKIEFSNQALIDDFQNDPYEGQSIGKSSLDARTKGLKRIFEGIEQTITQLPIAESTILLKGQTIILCSSSDGVSKAKSQKKTIPIDVRNRPSTEDIESQIREGLESQGYRFE